MPYDKKLPKINLKRKIDVVKTDHVRLLAKRKRLNNTLKNEEKKAPEPFLEEWNKWKEHVNELMEKMLDELWHEYDEELIDQMDHPFEFVSMRSDGTKFIPTEDMKERTVSYFD